MWNADHWNEYGTLLDARLVWISRMKTAEYRLNLRGLNLLLEDYALKQIGALRKHSYIPRI